MAGKYRVIVSEEAKAQLSAFPLSGPFDDDPDLPAETYRKCLFCGRYHILYEVENKTVYIDAIVDCRQESELM